jgi:enolase
MNTAITDIRADVIKNSRGHDTIVVTVCTEDNEATFSVPEGASTGSREVHAKEGAAVQAVLAEKVRAALMGHDVLSQEALDAKLHALDGTDAFDGIGGNLALGISVANAKLAAKIQGIETWQYIEKIFAAPRQAKAPRLFANLINGGKHAPVGSVVQEHQIIPQTDDVALAYEAVVRVQQALEEILVATYGADAVGKGDEGGFTIPAKSVFDSFQHIAEAIEKAALPIVVALSTDIAASSFFENGVYTVDGVGKDTDALMDFYKTLFLRFPSLVAVEDPFVEGDFASFARFSEAFPSCIVVGDDLTTTNVAILNEAIEKKAISGIIIKPNQIGTLSDTLATMRTAHEHGVKTIVSHRSGETMDDFIADLAYGTGSFGLKAGAPKAVERDAKYKRLIQIATT